MRIALTLLVAAWILASTRIALPAVITAADAHGGLLWYLAPLAWAIAGITAAGAVGYAGTRVTVHRQTWRLHRNRRL